MVDLSIVFSMFTRPGTNKQPPWQSHSENGGDFVAWGSASASSPRKMDGHPIAVAFDVSMAQKKPGESGESYVSS